MKKLLWLLIILISISSISAKEITLSETHFFVGDVSDINIYGGLCDVKLCYEDTLDIYYLYINTAHRFVLTKRDLTTLQNATNKALDWKKISISNNVSVEKELPDSSLTVELDIWNSEENSWKKYENSVNLSFVFKANPKENNWLLGDYSYYGICIDDPNPEYPVKPLSIRDIKFSDYYYRDYDESTLTEFSNAIEKRTIDAAIKQAEKQSNASSLFN